MPSIVLGSTSAAKKPALPKATQRVLCFRDWVHQYATGISGVNAQPVGLDEMYQGALNRAVSALHLCPTADVAVGAENGIIQYSQADVRWFDLAYILVVDRTGCKSSALSAAVECPSFAVRTARERGFSANTAGEVLAEMYPGINHADWHQHFAGVSRVDLLADAMVVALNQYLNMKGE